MNNINNDNIFNICLYLDPIDIFNLLLAIKKRINYDIYQLMNCRACGHIFNFNFKECDWCRKYYCCVKEIEYFGHAKHYYYDQCPNCIHIKLISN